MNRTYSLKRHKEFRYTYRVGRSVGSHLFSLVFAKNRTNSVKIGFSVSKRVGNSVQRNRAKRRLRACISPLLGRIRPGSNLIFVARRAVLSVSFEDMQRQMFDILSRAGLMENEM